MKCIYLYILCSCLMLVLFSQTISYAKEDRVVDDSVRVIFLMEDSRSVFNDQPQAALVLAKEAVFVARELNSKHLMIRTNWFLGSLHMQLGNYDEASMTCQRGMELTKSKGVMGARSLNRWGEIMRLNRYHEESFAYHNMALKIYSELGDDVGLSYTYNNIGLVHELIEDYDSAMYYHEKSLQLKIMLKDTSGITDSYSNMGTVYRRMGDLKKALEVQLKTLELDLKSGHSVYIAITRNNLGVLYMDLDKLDLAEVELEEAYSLAHEANATDVLKYSNQQLALLYEKKGAYEMAFEYYKVYSRIKDSLFNEDKSKEIGRLEAQYEFEKAEEDRKLEAEVKSSKEKEERTRRDNLQYSGILIVLVLLAGAVMMLGRFAIPVRLAEGLVFFSFLLFFEFMLVMLDPYIEEYSSGAPAIKLAFNAILAALIFPLHSFFETKIKHRLPN